MLANHLRVIFSVKAAVCDSGESLLIFEVSSQTNKQTHPSLQCSFKLR